MKNLAVALAFSILGTTATAQDFTVDFSWDGLELCTSGRPNTVGNPAFTLENVPSGTVWLHFQLTDLDAPHYPHGGGWIDPGVVKIVTKDRFTYKSPCPPNGAHRYTWEVTATNIDRSMTLGTASLTRKYPE